MNRILCVEGTQEDIFIAEKTDCSRIGNYDVDGLQFFVYMCSRTAFWDRTKTGLQADVGKMIITKLLCQHFYGTADERFTKYHTTY